MKQITYFVSEQNENKKKRIALSGLAFVIDWKLGWFEVPACFLDEYENNFGSTGRLESSCCYLNITKEEIKNKNLIFISNNEFSL